MKGALEKVALSMKESSGGGGNQRATAAMANLAEGIQGLVKHMRAEQQMMRDWVEAQTEQQKDIKKLLQSLLASGTLQTSPYHAE